MSVPCGPSFSSSVLEEFISLGHQVLHIPKITPLVIHSWVQRCLPCTFKYSYSWDAQLSRSPLGAGHLPQGPCRHSSSLDNSLSPWLLLGALLALLSRAGPLSLSDPQTGSSLFWESLPPDPCGTPRLLSLPWTAARSNATPSASETRSLGVPGGEVVSVSGAPGIWFSSNRSRASRP